MIVPVRPELRVRGNWAVKYHHVNITVRDQVADVAIDQEFVNTGSGMIEVEYLFPIPPGAADVNYNSAFKWNVSPGEDKYRRGMYTYFKRTAPHPNLMTFDCPDSNVTTVQRGRSNTPLAALITLNNDSFAEAAQSLSARVWSEIQQGSPGNDSVRLTRAFRLCLDRLDPDGTRAGGRPC
jgi:hypothetical protein